MKTLAQLLRYKTWANGLLFDALLDAPTEAVEAPRKIVFGSILKTLNHTYAMDVVWRAHLEGKPHGYTTRRPEVSPALDVLRGQQDAIDAWFVDYAEALSAAEADERVTFEFIGGGEGCMTREEILQHVVTHGVYHRGHIGTMMYDAGLNPPTTDYPVYLRSARAAAA